MLFTLRLDLEKGPVCRSIGSTVAPRSLGSSMACHPCGFTRVFHPIIATLAIILPTLLQTSSPAGTPGSLDPVARGSSIPPTASLSLLPPALPQSSQTLAPPWSSALWSYGVTFSFHSSGFTCFTSLHDTNLVTSPLALFNERCSTSFLFIFISCRF